MAYASPKAMRILCMCHVISLPIFGIHAPSLQVRFNYGCKVTQNI